MKRLALRILTLTVLGLGIYLFLQTPSNDRNWTTDASRIPAIRMEDNNAIISDVRDWRYDANGPTEERWKEGRYRPEDITRVWFVVNPFKGWDGVAHTMLVFDFKDSEPVVVSVEARREHGEDFWIGTGLLRQYELIYLWGTERDFYTRRAVYWGEELFMYPLKMDHAYAVELFETLARATNELPEHPRFYNSLTDNCTNLLADSANAVRPDTLSWHIARILPGYSEEFLYDLGYFDASGTLEEVKARYAVRDLVREVANEEDFSAALRQRLTGH